MANQQTKSNSKGQFSVVLDETDHQIGTPLLVKSKGASEYILINKPENFVTLVSEGIQFSKYIVLALIIVIALVAVVIVLVRMKKLDK